MFKTLEAGKIKLFCKVISSYSINVSVPIIQNKLILGIRTETPILQYVSSRGTNNFSKKIVKEIINRNKEKLRDTEMRLKEKGQFILKDIKNTKEKVKGTVEEIIEKENIYTIPNLLCITRILVTPYIGFLIVSSKFDYALIVLGVAALTDLLDGWIARTWESQSSRVGSFLDPIADKVLIGTLFLTLTYADLIPAVLTGAIIARDMILVTAGFVVRYKSLPSPRTFVQFFDASYATAQLTPTFISKVNTGIQLLLVGTTLSAPVFHYVGHPFLEILWYVTGASTVVSALSYVLSKNTYKIFKQYTPKNR